MENILGLDIFGTNIFTAELFFFYLAASFNWNMEELREYIAVLWISANIWIAKRKCVVWSSYNRL